MTCMFCKLLNRNNSNEKAEYWCEHKKQYVEMISPKCDGFVSKFKSEVQK